MLDLLLNLIETIAGCFTISDLFMWLIKKLIRILIKHFFKKLINRIKQRS